VIKKLQGGIGKGGEKGGGAKRGGVHMVPGAGTPAEGLSKRETKDVDSREASGKESEKKGWKAKPGLRPTEDTRRGPGKGGYYLCKKEKKATRKRKESLAGTRTQQGCEKEGKTRTANCFVKGGVVRRGGGGWCRGETGTSAPEIRGKLHTEKKGHCAFRGRRGEGGWGGGGGGERSGFGVSTGGDKGTQKATSRVAGGGKKLGKGGSRVNTGRKKGHRGDMQGEGGPGPDEP